VLDAIRWWLSLRRNATLRDWMEEMYTIAFIRRIPTESTDCNLHEEWNFYNPPGQMTLEGWTQDRKDWQQAVRRLYRRYGEEIWNICLPEPLTRGPQGEWRREKGLGELSRLDLADQVCGPKLFEEFLVRNALRLTALEILKEKGIEPFTPTAPVPVTKVQTQAEIEEYEALKAKLRELGHYGQ
jgi:hypothetical protein